MSGRVSSFDPLRVIATIGPVLLTGFADGEAITIERDADAETPSVGVDGDVVRVRSANKVARVTVRLQGGSPANLALRAMRALNNPLVPGADQGAFMMTDLNTGTRVFSNTAWISKEPLPSLGADAPVYEWEITCASLEGPSLLIELP